MAADPKNVLIVGAGPAGLLAAHHLLRNGEPGAFKVTIAERRADPRASEQASLRSYSLGLGVRGRTAIKKAGDDLWDLVRKNGVECEKFSLHIGKRVIQIRQESPVLITEPSVLINRADLCAALLEGFDAPGCAEAPRLRFETKCVSVDTGVKQVVVETAGGARETIKYDVLLGADGVNSKVRDAMLAAAGSSVQFAQAPLNGTLKTIHQPMPAALDPLSVHAMGAAIAPPAEGEQGAQSSGASTKPAERIGLFWVPERNRTTLATSACALINWDPTTVPTSLLAEETPEGVQRILNAAFPQLEGGITLDSARQFLEQTPAVNFVNKLSSYHDAAAAIALLGDAAHCTGGASGQGCNSALEDAAILAELLIEQDPDAALRDAGDLAVTFGYPDAALREFSKRRVAQGHALLDLAVTANSPKAPLLRVAYLLVNGLEGLGHKFFPRVVSPPTQNLLTQTDLPFTEIYRRKAWILDLVRASNKKLGVFSGYD